MDSWHNEIFAKKWDRTHFEGNPVRKEQLNIVKYFIEKYYAQGSSILDIGIGSGLLEQLLLETNENMRFFGIDFSKAMHELATKRLEKYLDKITYILEDLEKISTIGFPSSGNIAVSIQTLHNLNIMIKSAIYDRVISWLNPGGIYYIFNLFIHYGIT